MQPFLICTLRTAATIAIASAFASAFGLSAVAQSIAPALDGTGTIVQSNGNTFNLSGGTQAGSNLFHSFQQFGLSQGQVANFLSNSSIQNILARVTGGNASVINGLIQVAGSSANLYVMNPAGVVFGANASLNVPGSFTATTASAIGFRPGITGYPGQWFNASGSNDYAGLAGTPTFFALTTPQAGAIVNAGTLAVGQGQALTLLGGTVVNTGTLSAPGGMVTVQAIAGESLVRVTPTGSLLSLDLPLQVKNSVNPLPYAPATLPQLLTGGNLGNASGLTVNEQGTVTLTGSGIAVNPGDVVAQTVTAQTATLAADRNLTLVESQLHTTGDLTLRAKDTVVVRDSVMAPVSIQAGNTLTVQGDRGIDILALNHPDPAFSSGGALNLVSNGVISGDAHYTAGSTFSVRTLSGDPGNFVSLYDPIISVAGNVSLGNYTGSSLKIEALGSITINGTVTINSADATLAAAPAGSDRDLLRSAPSLILRAGLSALQETGFAANPSSTPPVVFLEPTSGTTFTGTANPTSPGTIFVQGDIAIAPVSGSGGAVILSAPGAITTQSITGADSVSITTPGNITARSIVASTIDIASSAGTVTLGDPTDSTVVSLDSFGGTSTVSAPGGIRAYGPIFASGVQLTSTGGDVMIDTITAGSGGVDIYAAGLFQAQGGRNRSNVYLSSSLSDDPEIDTFLKSKGLNFPPSQRVSVAYNTGGANDSLPVIYSISAAESGSAPAGSLNAPITIRFGGATRTLVDNSFPIISTDGTNTVTQGRILIQGGNGTFFLGPTVTGRLVPGINEPFLVKDAAGNFVPVTPSTYAANPVLYRNQTYTASFPTADFPADSSGLAGSIYVGFGFNTTLYGSSQSRVFSAVAPQTSVTEPGTTSTTATSASPATSTAASIGDPVQRNFDRQASGGACSASITVASAAGADTRSSRSGGSNPCAPPGEDTQILKILGDQ